MKLLVSLLWLFKKNKTKNSKVGNNSKLSNSQILQRVETQETEIQDYMQNVLRKGLEVKQVLKELKKARQ